MSNFSKNYTQIVESQLQKVRLKVDPRTKYAEDFAEFDGYEGYILAETTKSIDFFHNSTIITIPKKAVVIEGIGSALKSAAKGVYTGATDFAKGAFGLSPTNSDTGGGLSYALGRGAGALYGFNQGGNYFGSSGNQQQRQAPQKASQNSNAPVIDSAGVNIYESSQLGGATLRISNQYLTVKYISTVNQPAIRISSQRPPEPIKVNQILGQQSIFNRLVNIQLEIPNSNVEHEYTGILTRDTSNKILFTPIIDSVYI